MKNRVIRDIVDPDRAHLRRDDIARDTAAILNALPHAVSIIRAAVGTYDQNVIYLKKKITRLFGYRQ